MRLFISFALLFLSFQTLDCQRSPGNLDPRLNFFDIELLRATAFGKRGNVMVSPASVKSTLAMILAGAEGDTATEIEQALRISPFRGDVTEQLRWFVEALRANTSTAVLKNANGVFVSTELKLNPKFESIVRRNYQSEVVPVDFTDPAAAAFTINTWVSQHTNGLIPFIVEPAHVTPPNDLILANALYFKSSWLHAFDPRETRDSCFYRDGGCKMVPMMDMQSDLNYAHVNDLAAHAVELPYAGRRYSMILLVPLMKDGINSLLRDLPYVGFQRILELMHTADVTLSMPRFTVNYNEDLIQALQKLRITTLFTNRSNLTKISNGSPPQISSFHHKVFMSVDETGTVAAAASAAAVVPLMFDGSVQVRADRPFLFFIRDNDLGVVLFEGKIEEPTVSEVKPPVVHIPAPVLPIHVPAPVAPAQEKKPVVPVQEKVPLVPIQEKAPVVPVQEKSTPTPLAPLPVYDEGAIRFPSVENRQPFLTENSTTEKPKPKTSIFDNVKSFFGF